jgi:starch synthase (maltosyl-transferring)
VYHWDLDDPSSLRHFIALVNSIRRTHPALHRNASLRFHGIDNDQLLCWSKRSDDGTDVVLMVVNIDPWHVQSGFLDLDLDALGLDGDAPFTVTDLLTNAHYTWQGRNNFVQLDPASAPAHVFAVAQP